MAQNSFGRANLVRGHRTPVAYFLGLLVFVCLVTLWPVSAAQAACTSPQTATIASGGTATFSCADFGFIGPADTSPSHGSLTFGTPQNVSLLIYTNNGDGAVSDTFVVKDDFGIPITFNITITPSTSPLTVTPASLASPAIGTSYNQALSTTGGTGPYSYTHNVGNLPPGITLSSSGVLSGTPTGSGPYNFTVRVTDSTAPTPHTVDKSYSVTIAAPTIVVTPSGLPDGGVSVPYNVQFSASGGTAPYTYTRDGGSLPAGLTLSSSGLLAGTPTAAGSSTFTLKAQDSTTISTGGVHFKTQNITITINNFPPLTLSPASGSALSAGTVGAAYSQTISASGGSGSISYAVTSGALPAGLALNGSTGAIIGTPTAGGFGTANFTVTATAATTGSASASYSIAIAAPPVVLTPSSGALAGGTVGVVYPGVSISASGGLGTISYAVTSGVLPAGLALNPSTGAISGTPTAGGFGTFNFTVTATGATAGSASASYSITVAATPVVLTPSDGTTLTAGTVGSAYSDASISATGGAGAITYSVTAGGLPAGLTLNTSTGAINGTPTAGGFGTANFAVTATAATSGSATANYTIVIGAPPVVVTPATGTALIAGTVGSAYSQTISASGGVGAFTYVVSSGALPDGLTLNASTGAISGTPTAGAFGTANFTVTAAAATAGSASATYSIVVGAPPVVLTPATGTALSGGTVGSSYSDTSISASGGVGTFSYAVTSGALPAGLALDAATGAISGTPPAAGFGTTSFTVTATAATSGSASANYSIAIGAPALVLTPATGTALSAGTAGSSYSDTSISTVGGVGAISYAVTAGSLPAGLSLNASSGAISGTPTAGALGTATFTVTATAAVTGSASASYSIAIGAPTLVLTPATGTVLSAGTVGVAYSDTSISASGGVGTISYTVTAGSLPAGLSLNASSGAISGTPTAGALGTATFTVTATAAVTGSASASYSIAIGAPTLVLTPATGTVLSAGTVGVAYSDTSISASGGVGTISYAVTGGSLPVGLSLNASNGAISGTPTVGAIGTANFTVTATAATSGSATASYSITVAAVPVVLTPATGATLSSGTLGVAYSDTSISASGGVGGFTYAVTSGALPGGLMLDASSGRISGRPSADGDFRFTVTATDASGATGQANYSLSILPSNFVFSPSAGALPDAMVGEAYSSRISATGGVGALVYSVKSGDLPKGMVLNVSTGELTGPLASDATPDTYRFTIAVTDSRGASGSATYTLKLNGRSVTAPDFVVDVPAGSAPNNVYLNSGATGGPFISAAIASVEPPIAGKAEIVEGELAAAGSFTPVGYYLKFTPNPSYSGSAVVGYTLHSAFGSSNVGHVTYRIALDRVAVGEEIDSLVRDFVRTRQNLLSSTVQVPGLLDRRRAAASTDPVTTAVTPSDKGARLGFSSSLAQIQAARDAADAAAAGQTFVKTDQLFDIWVNGSFLFHKDEDDKSDKWGNFALFSVGADYLINDRALVGLSFHYDYMTDPTAEDAELTGNGWLAGPYASFEIGQGVFLDANLLYGGSSNDIDTGIFGGSFDTSRWMADVKLTGEWQLDELTVLTPKLRAVYFNEETDNYSVSNALGETIDLKGFIEEQARFSIGVDVQRTLELQNGLTLSPTIGADVGYASLDGEGLFGRVSAGLALSNNDNWDLGFSLLFNIEGDGSQSAGAKIGARVSF
ncbi:putative Ig domain-containing protein [Ensifer adhaerens]